MNTKNESERLRNHDVRVRATDMEYAMIKANYESSGCKTMNDYMINAAINSFVISIDYSQLKELCQEINKIGININQIAHKVNSEEIVYKTDIDDIKDLMESIVKIVRQQFYTIPDF